VYRLPEDGGVPPKHVGINKRLYCVCISCASAGFVPELLQIVCTLPIGTFVMVSLPCVVFAVLRTTFEYIKCKQRLLMKLHWINAE
jgi:uncharacterized membrane protein